MTQRPLFFYLLLAYFIFLDNGIFAQNLTLKQAIEIAEKNNLNIEIAKQESQSAKTLVKTAYDIPKTDFMGQYGNVNDFNIDYSFNINQNFALPKVYARQKRFLEAQTGVFEQEIQVQREILAKNVKLAYISVAFVKEKINVYQKQDSVFQILQKIADIRQKTGETSKLAYLNVQQKTKEIQFLYAQTQQEAILKGIDLQKILRTSEIFQIESLKNIALEKPSQNQKANFAFLTQKKQQIENQKQYTNWQKSLLSPDMKVGYYTMQEGENRNRNLHVAQLGVSVPIFNQAQRKRIASSQIAENIQENRYKNAETEAKYDLNTLEIQYQKQQKALDYYAQEQLPRLQELEKLSQTAYKNGEIAYFEVLQVQVSIFQTELAYLQELTAYLETLVQWQYLTGRLFE